MNTYIGMVLGLGLIRSGCEMATAAANAAGHVVVGDLTRAAKTAAGIPFIPLLTVTAAAVTLLDTVKTVALTAYDASQVNQHEQVNEQRKAA